MTAPRLLIIRLSSLGDVVHALPAAALLRRALPKAQIDWLVETRWAPLLVGNPDLSEVIAADTNTWRRNLRQKATWQAMCQCRRHLLARQYEIAIDFQGLFKSGFMAWLSGARQVAGFADRFCREPGAAIYYDRRFVPDGRHVVDQNLSLGRQVLCEFMPEVYVRLGAGPQDQVSFFLPSSREAEDYIEKRLAEAKVGKFYVVNPGGGWRSKCWPPERYGELCRQLAQAQAGLAGYGSVAGWQPVVSYGPGEESLVEAVKRAAGDAQLVAFPTDLLQLVALLRRAQFFVGGDTGPLHLAVAVGTPVVGLYGPTDPVRNGPYSPLGVVVCNPAERDGVTHRRESKYSLSMLSISVEQVLAAVEQGMRRASRSDGRPSNDG